MSQEQQDEDDENAYVAASVPISAGQNDLLACRKCSLVKAAVQVCMMHRTCCVHCSEIGSDGCVAAPFEMLIRHTCVQSCMLLSVIDMLLSVIDIDSVSTASALHAVLKVPHRPCSHCYSNNYIVGLQFQEEGCDNCSAGAMDDEDVATECTPNFSGIIAIMDPEKSWCARWTRKRASQLLTHSHLVPHASAAQCMRY
jgi:RNA polymerase subunit RPABC4/transcription elongation factor Spt4